MRPSTLAAMLALALAGACAKPAPPQPDEEFLVAAGDSTWWVQAGRLGVRVRGAPITLARIGGHFHEVYVTDDDRSFENAVFVSPRVFRRNLDTGDSTLVWEDSSFVGAVDEYARRHPDERALEDDEDAPDEPETSNTAEFGMIDLHGPYLSYEVHTDVDDTGRPAWHTTRRGVLDLRDGRGVDVARLFGDSAATEALRTGRRSYLAALDSVVAAPGEGAKRAARALGDFRFDPSSFGLTDLDGAPAVEFHAPGRGQGTAGGTTLPLPPIQVPETGWWRASVRPELPSPDTTAGDEHERWSHNGIAVEARYDSSATSADLVLLDGKGHEWRLARIGVPVYRIHWLGDQGLDSLGRRRLVRAFDEAAQYDESARMAADHRRAPSNLARIRLARAERPRHKTPHAQHHARRHAPLTRS